MQELEHSPHSLPPACPILTIGGLEQRLCDRDQRDSFTVYVGDPVTIYDRDFVALLGPSGCGKTTLLTVLGLLRRPTNVERLSGFSMWVHGQDGSSEINLQEAWVRRRYRRIECIRRHHLGFALQTGELLHSLTVWENIAVPLRLNGFGVAKCRDRLEELVEAFGLHRVQAVTTGEIVDNVSPSRSSHLAKSRVNRLSGGEYQRVCLARAIAHRPELVFVDEPTAALNRELARDALQQFQRLQGDRTDIGATVMITHDEQLAREFANVTIRMAPMRGRAAGEVVDVSRRASSGFCANDRSVVTQSAPNEGKNTEER